VLQNASIVVVDDEPDVLSMVSDYLGRDGYHVRSCASGAELDRAFDKASPDLVVLDVNLPDENGISIARRLQATHRVPIVMLTALADTIDRVVGLEVGADDYVTKPFDLRELSARVRAVLRRANDAGARATAPNRFSLPGAPEIRPALARPSSTSTPGAFVTGTGPSCRSPRPNSKCFRRSPSTPTRC
jgi:two-component system OmpR family response regulator